MNEVEDAIAQELRDFRVNLCGKSAFDEPTPMERAQAHGIYVRLSEGNYLKEIDQ